jgi:hypothetical protein
MDIETGRRLGEPNNEYDDQVLNASWLPPPVEAGLQTVTHYEAAEPRIEDVEAFQAAVYLFQE